MTSTVLDSSAVYIRKLKAERDRYKAVVETARTLMKVGSPFHSKVLAQTFWERWVAVEEALRALDQQAKP